MKRHLWMAIVAVMTLVFVADVEAQRGGGGQGGGGGGRGGGGHGGGHGGGAKKHSGGGGGAVNRTPSMSRSTGKRDFGESKPRAQQAAQQVQSQKRDGKSVRDAVQKGPQGGAGAQAIRRDNPQAKPQLTQKQRMDRQQSLDSTRQYLNKQKQTRHVDQRNLSQQQRDMKSHFRNHQRDNYKNYTAKRDYWHNHRSEYRNWFNRDFFDRHQLRPYYWNNYANWWTPYGWGGIAGWLGYTDNYPVYYYDDYGYPIQLEQNDIYIFDASQQPPPEESNVYIPVISGVTTPAPATDVQGDWLPLGVFAVGRNNSDINQSTMIVQLALSRNGEIAGTYYNSATDTARELVGEVDPTTQEAAWRFSDSLNSPIASTGLYNLSLPQTSIIVRFPNGSQQTWLLLRLHE